MSNFTSTYPSEQREITFLCYDVHEDGENNPPVPVKFFCNISTEGNPPLKAAFDLIDKNLAVTCIFPSGAHSDPVRDWEIVEDYWSLDYDGQPKNSHAIGLDLLENDLFGIKVTGGDWRERLETLSCSYPLGKSVKVIENEKGAVALFRAGDTVVEDQQGGFGLLHDPQVEVLGAFAVLEIPLDAVASFPSRNDIDRSPVPPAKLFDLMAMRVTRKEAKTRQREQESAPASQVAVIGDADESSSNELPAHLTRPAGLLSEMMDWITASALIPNRVLAFGAAITTLGTIIGRRVAGPTRAGTHLYIAMLAPSASGKDHPMRCAAKMLRAASSTTQLVGPGEFASQTALTMHMENRPLSLCCLDEFGAFLSRICSQKASPWERALTKTFRECWGASFETVEPMAFAGKSSAPIQWPAISVLGASVHCEFYGALGSKDATNGFLNRFLLLSSTSPIAFGDPDGDSREVPQPIIDRLRELYDHCDGAGAPHGIALADPSLLDQSGKILIAWESDAVRAEFRDLQRLAIEKGARADTAELYGRTAEIAVRLATIHAVSRVGLRAKLTGEDLAWGRELAFWSADTMAREASLRIADTAAQATAKHVLRTIHENRKRITHRDLNRKLQHRYKNAELKDALASLRESGSIEAVTVIPARGGTATTYYSVLRQP
ncbi:hypothetical protein M2323_003928 [Rhodoblastus acidophilus]|uniref:hypothetical protein n=1 Tax=Rhodoblastus acidophilus TaxID=1074 RepID=UPI002224DBCD|nr:hypothetical protein [Rhodoblastus acidophilus]MCW2286091.1 hypothetical protein [Rhodoblastus acidophilus]MCW2334985.1 hypothetical protein [Rhodoblastus acidophilus]